MSYPRIVRTIIGEPDVVLTCIGPQDARDRLLGYIPAEELAPFIRRVDGRTVVAATLDDLLETEAGSDWSYEAREVPE